MARLAFPTLIIAAAATAAAANGCTTDSDCSLNGVCSAASVCTCDAPWLGGDCGTLGFAPGRPASKGLDGKALCCYHGDDANSTSWGGSVLFDKPSGNFYMWVAVMTNHCTLGAWRTNSEVVLAKAKDALGPFTRLGVIVKPWAHNPQAIHAPDPDHGHVYALYTLGDGVPEAGPQKMCNNTDLHAVLDTSTTSTKGNVAAAGPAVGGRNITANFTIRWSAQPEGPYHEHVAQILRWPSSWQYGAHGNWNPAPMVHPTNGSIYLMAHMLPGGEAIIHAESWRGPYTVVAASTDRSWGNSTTTKATEDPFMWVDKRGNWHVLYHWMNSHGYCGGHSYSPDGLSWSNVTGAYNASRPLAGGGHANYGAERPKLLMDPLDGVTPRYIYNGGSKGSAWTIAQPLVTGASIPHLQ